jgi:hypothetical protein
MLISLKITLIIFRVLDIYACEYIKIIKWAILAANFPDIQPGEKKRK